MVVETLEEGWRMVNGKLIGHLREMPWMGAWHVEVVRCIPYVGDVMSHTYLKSEQTYGTRDEALAYLGKLMEGKS
jgi:hypothetical protein